MDKHEALSARMGLEGRVGVVTGAGSGIGRAIAMTLAAAGARVSVLDINDSASAETVDAIRALGGEAVPVHCNTADAQSVADAAALSERTFGPCRILVNNAGVLRPGSLDSLSLADWNALMGVNLTGYFLCAQAFGRQIRTHPSGALVHIGSVAGEHGTGHGGAYSVAKAGVAMLSKQLAVEWGSDGVRSNVVHPGLMLTPMSQAFYDHPGHTERRSQAIPLRRIGTPQDVADAVLFLVSDLSAYVTGHDLTVDGGFTRNLMNLIPRRA